MFGKNFNNQKPYRPIKASTINRPKDEAERFGRMSVAAPLGMKWIAGIPLVEYHRPEKVKARLVAHVTGNSYTWRGVYDTSGGNHADLPANISDNGGLEYAYEDNGNATLTPGPSCSSNATPTPANTDSSTTRAKNGKCKRT
jgi:hypothetical protein